MMTRLWYLADSIEVQELLFLIALICLPSRELRCGHCMMQRAGRAGREDRKGMGENAGIGGRGGNKGGRRIREGEMNGEERKWGKKSIIIFKKSQSDYRGEVNRSIRSRAS
jgi:hypothetical protein